MTRMATESATAPRGCTNLKLRQASRLITRHYEAYVAPTGLKNTQYSLLSYVVKLGPIRPGELAQAMMVDASTLTRNLKPLIDAGWVTLTAGSDGRSRLVNVTDAGRDKRTEAQRHWKIAQEQLNALLGVPRVLALHDLIHESLDLLSPPDKTTDAL